MNSQVDKKTTGSQSQSNNIKNPADKQQGFDKKQNLGNSSLDQKQDRTSTGKSDFQQDQKRASSLKDY